MNHDPKITGTIGEKPVVELTRKSIINLSSGFREKLLCDGPTFSTGDACVYSCSFCYVAPQMFRTPGIPEAVKLTGKRHEDIVIRRRNPAELVRSQLYHSNGKPKYTDETDKRVIYASPLVDVAATLDLCRETVAVCLEILKATNWQIRLLSKSSFLPIIAKDICKESIDFKPRMIYGVSTGTANDALAAAFEQGTALVSKRLQSLHKLQDEGHRTFGMICPSLPTVEYEHFSWHITREIRVKQCEHVWAEVMNVRGDSMVNTCKGLRDGGFEVQAKHVEKVSKDSQLWELYSRATFLAHTNYIPSDKLRFLQYVDAKNIGWWMGQKDKGAVLLGKAAHG